MDFLIEKAWKLYSQTARVPVQTILTATIWLEEKYRKAPCGKLAQTIALHYLILALRCGPAVQSNMAREYCAEAARWRALACAAPPKLTSKAIEKN